MTKESTEEKDSTTGGPSLKMIMKCGTKMAHTISYVKNLLESDPDARILLFSQVLFFFSKTRDSLATLVWPLSLPSGKEIG